VAQDTQIFCGCKPAGLCLTIIRVPVGVFELAGSADLRVVAEEHVDALPGRVVERGRGYAIVEWIPSAGTEARADAGPPPRPPSARTRRTDH
jgi:hypothetical protein